MRRREFASVIALETLLAGQKTLHYEAAYSEPGRTASPVTYIIDYTVDHLDNAGYLKTLGEAPPQSLHVGQDTPFAGASGPVCGRLSARTQLRRCASTPAPTEFSGPSPRRISASFF